MVKWMLCKLFGHKRGKRSGAAFEEAGALRQMYACPRCGATWARKVK